MAEESNQQELIFGRDKAPVVNIDQAWYQDHIGIIFPVVIIVIGIFQFVLRKWVLPVSEEVMSELADQFPSQSLLYNPMFGVFLITLGFVLLLIFNIPLLV